MEQETVLKVAAEEIKEILRKYDIAGIVSLHNVGFGEYFMHLRTSYSCAYQISDETMVFKSKREDYKTQEEHIKKLSDTANMLEILKYCVGMNYMSIHGMAEDMNKITNAEHS
jgi:hypothetical protein